MWLDPDTLLAVASTSGRDHNDATHDILYEIDTGNKEGRLHLKGHKSFENSLFHWICCDGPFQGELSPLRGDCCSTRCPSVPALCAKHGPNFSAAGVPHRQRVGVVLQAVSLADSSAGALLQLADGTLLRCSRGLQLAPCDRNSSFPQPCPWMAATPAAALQSLGTILLPDLNIMVLDL